MNNTCGCGGAMRPMGDNNKKFTWSCEKCGKEVSQRKRQPKKKVDL